ncbi:hypothetical protein D3C76_661890 [compost metagenome]
MWITGAVIEAQACQPHRQRQVFQQTGLAQQQVETAVLNHVRQALAREFGVQRHIGRAAFQHRQQADDQLRAATQRQADTLAGAGSVFDQAMGQAVGLGIEFAVAQAPAVDLQCQRIRSRGGLSGDAFMDQKHCG